MIRGLIAIVASCLLLAQTPAAVPTGYGALNRAIALWQTQNIAPFESFTLRCNDLLKYGMLRTCGGSASLRVTMSTIDGMASVSTVPPNGEAAQTLATGYSLYQLAVPVGFRKHRVLPQPGDESGDLKTIATVSVGAAYNMTVESATCQNQQAFHLTLVPRSKPDIYPLRSLTVLVSTGAPCAMDAQVLFHGRTVFLHYDFDQRGALGAQVVVRALIRLPGRSFDWKLNDIAFAQQSTV